MPFYYSATNTPGSGSINSGRQISLSLKDLDASSVGSIRSEHVSFDENYPGNSSNTPERDNANDHETLRSSYQEVDQYEQQYQNNVNMLLNKSSGSKYEEMIKKFLSERVSGGGDASSATPRTPKSAGKTRTGEDISLVESSTKLDERAAARQSRSAILRRSQQKAEAVMHQEVITEVLSAPLERNKYVPPDRSGTPTNLRGRQRAPPRSTHSKSPINSTNKYKKTTQNVLHARGLVEVGSSRSVSVSIEDFNDWIAKNQSWRDKVAKKKEQKRLQKDQQDSLNLRSPSLSSSVQLQAERSYIRKHSGDRGSIRTRSRSQSDHPPQRMSSRSPSPRPDGQSQEMGVVVGDKSSMQLDELEDSQSLFDIDTEAEDQSQHHQRQQQQSQQEFEYNPPTVVYEKDVFRRLYAQGKQYNDFNETMDDYRSRGRFLSNEMSFSPRINPKSRTLMKNRSSTISSIFRSCSPSSYRLSDISFEERQQHAAKAHQHRVRSMSPAMQRRQARESVTLRGSTLSKSYLSSKGGKMYPEAVISSILAEGKVSDVLCSSRNKSMQNATIINQERKRLSCNNETLSDGGKMFEPRMVSKESKRINSRDETTFEDRMLKSMDEYRIKVKVNKDAAAVTPGPGQYSNTQECNRCCPLPRGRKRGGNGGSGRDGSDSQDMRSKSPGAGSYSFSRARRELI